jgi:hypothetical protein
VVLLDQYEHFDTTQDASCDGTHEMPECDFVDLVVDVLEVHMPKFIGIYRRDEMVGRAWTSDILMDHIKALASKGQLKVEKDAQNQHKVATNLLRQHQHEAMPYGVNEADTRWEYAPYGYGSPSGQEFDDHHRHSKGRKGKGTGSWYDKGWKGKGGWCDCGGHGSYGSYGGGYDGDCHGDGYGGNSNSDRGWKREYDHPCEQQPLLQGDALHELRGSKRNGVHRQWPRQKATCGRKGGDMGATAIGNAPRSKAPSTTCTTPRRSTSSRKHREAVLARRKQPAPKMTKITSTQDLRTSRTAPGWKDSLAKARALMQLWGATLTLTPSLLELHIRN